MAYTCHATATDCASWLCASDNGSRYCVESCKPGQCPSGFGCRDDGMNGGVCWPGYDEGAGCAAGGGNSPISAAGLGLGFLALLLRRRQPAARSERDDRQRTVRPLRSIA